MAIFLSQVLKTNTPDMYGTVAPHQPSCASRKATTVWRVHPQEQLLWGRTFRNAEELCLALVEFREPYDKYLIVERLEHRTSNQVTQQPLALGAAA